MWYFAFLFGKSLYTVATEYIFAENIKKVIMIKALFFLISYLSFYLRNSWGRTSIERDALGVILTYARML